MCPNLRKLEWDSNFFNFNIGQVEGVISHKDDLQRLEGLFDNSKTTLAYFSSPEEITAFVYESNELDFILVDKKTTYSKNITKEQIINNKEVSSIDININLEKLEKLAVQSGIHSRFNIDKKIGEKKFEELYRLMMRNSINRKIAKEVLIYKFNDEVAGFVTLGEKNNRADIGIIAVDNLFRGKGIGKKLLISAENWFFNVGYKAIQVVTQGDNIAACKLYESCGYSVEGVEFFYHIWKK